MISNKPRRLQTFSYRGRHRYFATFCTARRRTVFANVLVGQYVAQQILIAGTRHEVAVVAYCVMPDHIHLLAEGTSDTADFRAFMAFAKQRAGFWYKSRFERPLWQEGYQDRVLRTEEASISVAAYIVMNPVRAGLVTSPELYPLSGSGTADMLEILDWIQMGNEIWRP